MTAAHLGTSLVSMLCIRASMSFDSMFDKMSDSKSPRPFDRSTETVIFHAYFQQLHKS